MAYSIYIKHMFTTIGCFEDAMLLQLPGFTFVSSSPYSNCAILVVRSKFLSLCKTNKLHCEQRFFSSTAFIVYEVVRVACLSRSYKTNRLRDRHTSDGNDIVKQKC